MEIEHVALNVARPAEMARWYAEHLGMRIVLSSDEPPYAHFLAESDGHVMIEIYHNPDDPIPCYPTQSPARLHVAFRSTDPKADMDRLVEVGASYVEDVHLPDDGYLVTLRDPWGLAIQLVRRGKPMA